MSLALDAGSVRSQTSVLHQSHRMYKWLVLANVMIGTFMAVLDSTIVNVGLPKIMATFGVTIDKIEWVMTAYLLVLAVMLPTSGWVADHFGYKKTYGLALTLFTIGSFLCGMARRGTVRNAADPQAHLSHRVIRHGCQRALRLFSEGDVRT